MKKILFLPALLAIIFTGCKKDIDPDGLSPGQREIEATLSAIGTLPVDSEKKETTVLDEQQGTPALHTDPETGLSYVAIPVKTTKTYDITNNPEEFFLLNPWAGIWPGSLIQGGSIKDGVPATIPINAAKRNKTNIRLTAVTGGNDLDYYKETEMSGSAVTQAMNELISQHIGNAIDVGLQFQAETVQSLEELSYKLGLNFNFAKVKLESSFGSTFSNTKSYVAVKLIQPYFTIAVDALGIDTFTPEVTYNDLKNYTGDANPMCYVESVTYGRIFILLYESSASERTLKADLDAMFGKISTNDSFINTSSIQSSSVKLMQIGGDPVQGLQAALFKTPEALRSFLVDGAVPTRESPGSLISYKINHLINNQIVKISNTLKYTVTEQQFVAVTPQRNVTVDLFNLNAYAGVALGKYTVSNHAKVTIDQISVGLKPKTGSEISFVVPKNSYKSTIGLKNSFIIPIHYTRSFTMVPADTRIVIKVTGKVHHEAWKNWNSNSKYDAVLDLQEEFEYSEANNSWDIVQKRDNYDIRKFDYVNHKVEGGDMQSEIKLNYRFNSDGLIYPLNN